MSQYKKWQFISRCNFTSFARVSWMCAVTLNIRADIICRLITPADMHPGETRAAFRKIAERYRNGMGSCVTGADVCICARLRLFLALMTAAIQLTASPQRVLCAYTFFLYNKFHKEVGCTGERRRRRAFYLMYGVCGALARKCNPRPRPHTSIQFLVLTTSEFSPSSSI